MFIGDLINQVVKILNDVDMLRWERDELIRYMNAGIRMVCNYRPDASTVIGNVQLQEGTMQAMPAGAQRLHDAICNTNVNGPGAALRLVDRKTIDAIDPNWHSATPSSVIDEVVTDEKFPEVFWVNPPAKGIVQLGEDEWGDQFITLGWSTVPIDIDPMGHTDQVFPLASKYAPAVVEWMLYEAFAQDGERSPNAMRSADHRNTFFNILGVKTKSDGAYAPVPRGA